MNRTIKCFLLTAFLFYAIFAGFLLPSYAEDMGGPKVGDMAENFSLTDMAGKTVELKSYSGKKAVLIVFWASW
jgi:cytochrome oxidase Cu insertion factor (SCO1/SenC/PrrC family)